jgi:rhodanese-related sulfurtransferase
MPSNRSATPVAEPPLVSSEASARPTPAAPDRVDGPTARIHWIGSFVHDRHPADLYAEMEQRRGDLVIVDARYPESFAHEHIPGAINLPWRDVDESTTAELPRESLYVVYCWNASCHASTRTATRLRTLGFQVKELHGGLEYWRKQGYPTERQ